MGVQLPSGLTPEQTIRLESVVSRLAPENRATFLQRLGIATGQASLVPQMVAPSPAVSAPPPVASAIAAPAAVLQVASQDTGTPGALADLPLPEPPPAAPPVPGQRRSPVVGPSTASTAIPLPPPPAPSVPNSTNNETVRAPEALPVREAPSNLAQFLMAVGQAPAGSSFLQALAGAGPQLQANERQNRQETREDRRLATEEEYRRGLVAVQREQLRLSQAPDSAENRFRQAELNLREQQIRAQLAQSGASHALQARALDQANMVEGIGPNGEPVFFNRTQPIPSGVRTATSANREDTRVANIQNRAYQRANEIARAQLTTNGAMGASETDVLALVDRIYPRVLQNLMSGQPNAPAAPAPAPPVAIPLLPPIR